MRGRGTAGGGVGDGGGGWLLLRLVQRQQCVPQWRSSCACVVVCSCGDRTTVVISSDEMLLTDGRFGQLSAVACLQCYGAAAAVTPLQQ